MWHQGRLVVFVILAIFAWGCESDDCSADGDCERGQICQSKSCVALPCASAADCPEGNRTCVLGYNTCGQKECNTGAPETELCQASLCDQASFTCLIQCSTDEECSAAGPNLTCQNQLCKPTIRSVGGSDVPVIGGMDAGVINAPTVMTDAGFVPEGVSCAPCDGDNDCSEIGAGATCEAYGEGGPYCFASCAGGIECPAGFTCRPNVDLCVPTNGTCDVCPGKPCAPGLVCDLDQNECVAERMLCERCFGPDSCVDGAECVTVDERDVCVKPCMDGMCDSGSECENGHCIPTANRCDPCGQSCGGQTPVCVESMGVCGQCSPDVPCGLGEYCNETNWLCEVATMCESCTSDESCGTCTGRPYCVGNECVVCLQDTDCPPRFTCTADFACESSPCGGVTCQSGTTCDPAQGGLCVKADGSPGCTSAADCGLPELQCNVSTGQCYYPDGQCDPGGENGVCMPGGICQMDGQRGLFLGVQTPVFTCACKQELSAQTVCHPGQTCEAGFDLTGGTPPTACFK